MRLAWLVLVALPALLPAQERAPSVPDKQGVPLPVRLSVAIANHAHRQTLAGYIAVAVDEKNWARLLKDSDLGPLLKATEQRPERTAVALLGSPEQFVFCVYFDGLKPIAVVALPASHDGKIAEADVKAAYKTVTPEMLTESDEELYFVEGTIQSDDGQPLSSFKIASAGKRRGR